MRQGNTNNLVFLGILLIQLVLSILPAACQSKSDKWRPERQLLVQEIAGMGVENKDVLRAMNEVPRHLFVPSDETALAYWNQPLPIGFGQTISQPVVVAYMTEALKLKPADRVLEIGTGCGYQAAVLSLLVKEVFSIEIVKPLGETARKRLADLGYKNVTVRIGDGYRGWPENAPFDAIIVTAASEQVPKPLVDQLALGGRLVMPVGAEDQRLLRITKTKSGLNRETLMPVIFVPMTGEAQKK
jgi:protein-L-isoaspartate(D-aspartate) O-methyltransferase